MGKYTERQPKFTIVHLTTLEHIFYNPATDKIESDRSIRSKRLSSFELDEQWRTSSGGEEMFHSNNTSGITYYSVSGGLKDHAIGVNRAAAGLVIPFARSYAKIMLTSEVNGPVLPLGAVVLSSAATAPNDVVVVGIEIVLAEQVFATDVLTFNAHFGPDRNATQIFQQIRTNETFVAGDRFIWWFDEPAVTKAGQLIFAEILVNDDRLLLVRPGANDDTSPYSLANVRLFDDLPVILRADNNTNKTFKMLKLTGTTGASEGDTTEIPHGIDYTTIMSMNGAIIGDGGNNIGPGNTSLIEAQFYIHADAVNAVLDLDHNKSGQLLNKPFIIMITYED